MCDVSVMQVYWHLGVFVLCMKYVPKVLKLVRARSGPGGPLFAVKIGLIPNHFWLPNLVWVAKSGPGFINLHEISLCPVKFVYMVCC